MHTLQGCLTTLHCLNLIFHLCHTWLYQQALFYRKTKFHCWFNFFGLVDMLLIPHLSLVLQDLKQSVFPSEAFVLTEVQHWGT